MAFGERPASEAYSLVCPFAGALLTSYGGLLGAIELAGIDPDALTKEDATSLALMTANIYGAASPYITVTQYYVHAESTRVTLRDRLDSQISHRLSKRREEALNDRGLAGTRLIHILTYRDPRGWNESLWKVLAANLPMLPFDRNARQILKAKFSAPSGLVLREQELRQRAGELRRNLDDVTAKWSQVMDAKVMTQAELWRVCKFLATFNERYLELESRIPLPMDDLDVALPDGDVIPVAVDYVDMLKLTGSSPRYFRTASILKMPHNPIGLWTAGLDAPVRRRGNFMYSTSFAPLTEFEKSLEFRNARNRLERVRLDLKKLFMGDQAEEKRLDTESYGLRQKRSELEKAESYEDRWGTYQGSVTVFDRDPSQVVELSDQLTTTLTAKGLALTWEAAGLPNAYETLQAGGHTKSVRSSTVTLSRAAAISLISKSATGSPSVPDLEGEEAVYVLETEDGNPLYYSPYYGGKAFAFGVGPIRSGKTFFKNTISTHFLKYPGSYLRALDIDPGTEPIARFFGEDGGIVRLESGADGRNGLNPFVSTTGRADASFVPHMLALCKELLQANDTEEGRTLTQEDQDAIDHAVLATVRFDKPELRTFTHMVEHMPKATKQKFARWLAGGTYAGLFNAKVDGIGAFDKRVGVINLYEYRDRKAILRPVFLELFYRVTRLFEAPEHRSVPKQLDIDEAHHPLAIPEFRDFVVSKVRTWAKFNASITMWTQNPSELKRIDDWDAIRTAASTFIFLADSKMDEELYKDTFKLTNGICRAIRTLVPRKEAFIVQPEAGLAKKVILRAEPEQYVINTSHPMEVARRERLIAEHGFDEGLRRAVQEQERHTRELAAEAAE
jgi:type IV secretion system protein VirB4